LSKSIALLQAKQKFESASGDQGTIFDPKAEVKAKARSSLLDFICYTMPSYEVNWHHRLICDAIEQLLWGDIDRLMILTPPRHGKSQITSRHLPPYVFGINPDAQIIGTSYGADLAARMNRDAQRIIDTPLYRDLFPGSTLNSKNVSTDAKGSYLRNSEIFEIVGHKGSYRGAGIGQGITGMGFWLGVIDDPIKNRADAESKTVRDTVWDWYTSTFRTRAEKGAKILITLTPWHPDDLHGRLLKQSRENPQADQWHVLRLPAIAPAGELYPKDLRQEGEALWPGKYPIEDLIKIKFSVGDYDWASLYQCNPTIEGGNIFNPTWFDQRWFSLPHCDKIVISVYARFRDTASSSFVTIQAWGKSGREYTLLDQTRDRLNYLNFKTAIAAIIQKWEARNQNISEMLIETRLNGTSIVEDLAQTMPILVTPTTFKGDSDGVRGQSVAGLCQEGCVSLPSSDEAAWVSGLLDELADFPSGETVDRANAFCQALIYLALRNAVGLVAEAFDRRTHALTGQDAAAFTCDRELPLHLSFDFNRHPATCIAAQVVQGELVILREWYLLNSNTFELAKDVFGWVKDLGSSWEDIGVYGDASGNNRTANSDKSNWQIVWDEIKRQGLRDRCRKRYGASNPAVLDTTISLNNLFRSDKLFILLPTCPELVKDLEQLRWKGDQIDKSDLMRSHCFDCLRYLSHTLFPYRRQGQTKVREPIQIEGVPF
jgi:phage terminase large subunit-like protein